MGKPSGYYEGVTRDSCDLCSGFPQGCYGACDTPAEPAAPEHVTESDDVKES